MSDSDRGPWQPIGSLVSRLVEEARRKREERLRELEQRLEREDRDA